MFSRYPKLYATASKATSMMDYLRNQGSNALRRVLLGAGTILSVSCGDDPVSRPTEGTVQVTTNTSGSDLDEDGYTVSIDGGTPQAIGILDTLIMPEIEPGDHPVLLGGVAPNCTVGSGPNQRIATVPVGDTVKVAFPVTCESVGPPGGGDPVP